MQVSRFIPRRLYVSFSLLTAGVVLLAFPFARAAQKTGLHVDGSPADPFQEAPGKPVVLVFVRTDCPISNRYAPLIQRISAQYAGKAGFWLVYLGNTASAEKIRSEEHTSELQSRLHLVCRLLLEKKKKKQTRQRPHHRLLW